MLDLTRSAAHVLLIEISWLPVDEPVAVFGLALAVFLIAPILIERFGMPGIVGIVLMGIVIGPDGVGILEHTDAIQLLGAVGLVYLLFMVGLELDLQQFFNEPQDAAMFGLASFFIPLSAGTVVSYYVLGLNVWAALLLAAVFSSHTLLAYPIIDKLSLSKNEAVTSAFGGILFSDTISLVILVIVLAAVDGGLTIFIFAQIVLFLLILFGGIWLVVPRISTWFFRNTTQESYFEFLLVVTLVFIGATLAEGLGLAAILGAFVVGLALNREITSGGTLMNRIEFVGNALFIPFFLLDVGMRVDLGVVFDGIETLWFAGVIIVTMIVMKAIAAGGVTLVQGYNKHEFGVLTGLSIGQAAAALAITLIAFEQGLFDEIVLNAVVLMVLISAILSPFMTRQFGSRLAQSQEIGELDREPFDPSILLPLSHYSEYQRRLVELAFAFKDSPSTTPIHLLRVLSPTASDNELAQAEADLEETGELGSAAEIEVEVQTRVNRNVPSAIITANTETRSDLVLMGWDAKQSIGGRVFGTVIDQVRRRCSDPVLVSRLGRPINTVDRVILVLPPGIDHNEGFFEGVFLAKRLTDNIGVELEVWTLGGTKEHFDRLISMTEPEMPFEIKQCSGWPAFKSALSETGQGDLLVALKPLEGTTGWHSQLRNLPHLFSRMPPESFIIITPRRGEPERQKKFLRIR